MEKIEIEIEFFFRLLRFGTLWYLVYQFYLIGCACAPFEFYCHLNHRFLPRCYSQMLFFYMSGILSYSWLPQKDSRKDWFWRWIIFMQEFFLCEKWNGTNKIYNNNLMEIFNLLSKRQSKGQRNMHKTKINIMKM